MGKNKKHLWEEHEEQVRVAGRGWSQDRQEEENTEGQDRKPEWN